MLKFISKNLFTGLMTILPIMLTVYLVYWLAITAESVLKARGQSVKTENGLEQGALLYIP